MLKTKAQLKTAKEELAAGKKDLLNAKAADQVKEIEAIERDLERARDLMEEIADTPMDDISPPYFTARLLSSVVLNLVVKRPFSQRVLLYIHSDLPKYISSNNGKG